MPQICSHSRTTLELGTQLHLRAIHYVIQPPAVSTLIVPNDQDSQKGF